MHLACSKVYCSKVLLQELCCHGLISLRFLKFLFSSCQVSCNSCIPVSLVNLTTHLFIYHCGGRDLITWGSFVLGLLLQSFPDTPPPENPHHVLKQQRAASSFSCWGLFFMAWVIGYILLALILSCIISCTFFSFLFFFLNNSVIWSYCLLSINSLNAAASSSELQTFSFESALSFCFCFLMGKCWLVTPACRETGIDWHAVAVLLPGYSAFTHTIFSFYSGG